MDSTVPLDAHGNPVGEDEEEGLPEETMGLTALQNEEEEDGDSGEPVVVPKWNRRDSSA